MPYANIEDRRKYQKKWIAEKRRRLKEEKDKGELTKGEMFVITLPNGFSVEITPYTQNPMSSDDVEWLKNKIKKALYNESPLKTGFRDILAFIPNILSLGNDLQMLKHRGGTV